MNKKFLSAILFGALMVTSTGTFVSCKDYDGDIEELQTQINSNKSAIEALQKLVGSGNWVTGVAGGADGLVVTMSNGSTVSIPTINGEDGKNGTEWTIGEDGFWYKDGEKTENVAVAQNGKDGVTAPSPKIENGVWVVYNWDAEKGEFVAETTDIQAAGTSSYVVLKNGAYILNIADENGEFVEISLPATAESFTVGAIANKDVLVNFTYGEWKTPTKKADKELFDKLAAEFPELKEYKDGQFVAQNNKLPFMVTPANVQLTDEHSFALISLEGKDAEATLENPAKGMPEKVDFVTRAAEGGAVWSVDFTPALNKKGTDYVKNNEILYSLVVSGPKGVIAATPYVYKYTVNPAGELNLNNFGGISKKYNEEGMDILAKSSETDNCFTLPTEVLNGKYIIEATDPAQIEKYGISVEGSVVTLENMPKTENTDGLKMKITAISVNGAVAEKTFTLYVNNEIAATGALADQEVVLTGSYKKNGTFDNTQQTIWWSLEDLKLTAVQKQDLVNKHAYKTLVIKDADENVVYNEYSVWDAQINGYVGVTVYESDMTTAVTAENYMKAAYISATIDAATWNPGEYTVVFEAKYNTTVIKAESDLTLVNPEEDMLVVKESYLDEDGVVIAATTSDTQYQFDLANIFEKVAGTIIANYVDVENEYDPATYAVEWLKNNSVIDAGRATWTTDGELDETEVDKVRTIKVTYNLFGNPNNQKELEIKVKWASSIYAEDAAAVLTVDAAKMNIKFDDVAGTNADESKVNLKSIITGAIHAQGPTKGQKYNFFAVAEGEAGDPYTYVDYEDYAKDATSVYPLNANGTPIAINADDLVKFGMTVDQYKAYVALGEDAPAIYLTAESQTVTLGENNITLVGWDEMVEQYLTYYAYNAKGEYKLISDTNKPAADDKLISLFNTYKSSLVCKSKETGSAPAGSAEVVREADIFAVTLKYANADDAVYFESTLSETSDNAKSGFVFNAKPSASIDKTSLVEGKKVVPMQLIITDVWGKEMVYEFNITISL